MIVLAHSLAGISVTAWVHDYAPRIKAMVLAAPALAIKLYVPLAIPGLRMLLRLRRGKKTFIKSYVKSKMLTHDVEQARGNARVCNALCQPDRDARCIRSRLPHDRVPDGKRDDSQTGTVDMQPEQPEGERRDNCGLDRRDERERHPIAGEQIELADRHRQQSLERSRGPLPQHRHRRDHEHQDEREHPEQRRAHVLEDGIYHALNQPFAVEDEELRLSFKCGIAMYPGDGGDAETLLVNAGANNTAWYGDYKGHGMLFAEGRGMALAVASSVPWIARSAG